MELDIDYLHDTIEGKNRGRQSGQTTALAVKLVQSLMFEPFGKRTYAVIVPHRIHGNIIIERMKEVHAVIGDDEGLLITRRNGFVQYGENRVEFVTNTNISRGLSGKRISEYFVDSVVLTKDNILDLEYRVIK